MRLLKLKFYFKDTPHPWVFEDVSNFSTEGGLVRIVQDKKSQWFPLENIFRIIELERNETSTPEKPEGHRTWLQ